ncbi:hypothetical protein X777_16506 [Ooceraea biroi]|uniref:Uncharacterized protein n=1 Tax=Ooceraea biroi TaxID=2015173 RepID=A0A026VWM1_OOCBI|nr:hypothetical protein X777_16506 [Ooceraea biroi]
MCTQQAAYHPDVRLEDGHVDVRLEADPRADDLGDATELGEVAHHRERVQGVDQRQGEAAPRVEPVAAQRAQLVVRIRVGQVAGIRVVEHGPYLLSQDDQLLLAVLPKPAREDQKAQDRARSEQNHFRFTVTPCSSPSVIIIFSSTLREPAAVLTTRGSLPILERPRIQNNLDVHRERHARDASHLTSIVNRASLRTYPVSRYTRARARVM